MAGEQPIDLGLTEFVSKLIDDTFSAVTQTARDQAQRDSEITAAAEMDFADFKERYISAEDVEDELIELFPSDNQDQPHAIYAGGEYIPQDDTDEVPPILGALGLRLQAPDFKEVADGFVFTDKGVTKIKHEALDMLARESHKAFREIVERGIPRVIVDTGRILAKISFSTYQLDDSSDDASSDADVSGADRASRSSTPTSAIANSHSIRGTAALRSNATAMRLSKSNLPRLSKIRMKVTPAAKRVDSSSDTPSEASSIYGEVEINFRTVER